MMCNLSLVLNMLPKHPWYSNISSERLMLLHILLILILKKSFLLHTIALRNPCCFICIVCWPFYWIFWCFFWDIGAFWVNEGNVVFAASPCVLNFESMFHLFIYFVHSSLSKMLIWFLFICLHWRRNWKGRKRQHPEVHFIFVDSFK